MATLHAGEYEFTNVTYEKLNYTASVPPISPLSIWIMEAVVRGPLGQWRASFLAGGRKCLFFWYSRSYSRSRTTGRGWRRGLRWIPHIDGFMATFTMGTGGHYSPCCLLIGQYPHHMALESICSIGFLSLHRDCTLLQVCKYSYWNIASQKYVTMLWKLHVFSASQFSEEAFQFVAALHHKCMLARLHSFAWCCDSHRPR